MGFAKYQEDIVSRYVHDHAVRPNPTSPNKRTRLLAKHETHATPKQKQRTVQMSSLKEFVATSPRPLPVIVLADTSGSMSENGKIEALNQSLKEMIQTFATESRIRAEIQVGIITFGGASAEVHLPLTPAHQIIETKPIGAKGATPMGQAFEAVRQLLEDRDVIPSRAYRPALILVSDGLPTDDWEKPFADLRASERAQKATRFAMAIGGDADEAMLAQFANDREAPLFKAHEARDIHRFFRAVTMSVTSRTASANPDLAAGINLAELPDDEVLDLDF
jgi:uncharacterized protein YegL